MERMRHEGPAWLLAALALAVVLAVVRPATAEAHAFLVRTTPQAGERLATSPAEVGLWFSEPVVARSGTVAVRTADGQPVSVGPLTDAGSGARLRAVLPSLGDGIYVVTWQVLADDGHLSAGEFAFAVGDAGELPAASSTSGAVSWSDAVASGLFLGGLVLAIGGLVSEAVIWRPVARRRGLSVPSAPVAAGLLLALAGAALQFALLVRAQAGTEWDPRTWSEVLSTRPGLATAAALGLVAYTLPALRWPRLRVWSLGPLTTAAVAAAVRGHSGTSGEWWAAPANALHLVLAAFWVGALVHLILVLWRVRAEGVRKVVGEAARRYAGLALIVVPPLLIAGVVTAIAEFSRPRELLATTYGRVLLLKLLLVVAALALALASRLRALSRPRRLVLLRRLTRSEGAVLVGVVAVTAVLVSAAPPRGAAAEADLLGPAPLTGPVVRMADLAGQLGVFVAAAEGELQVRIIAPDGEPAGSTRVRLQGQGPSGDSLDLYPRSCGRGCVSMGFAWQDGITHLTAAVSGGTWDGGTVQFGVPWPPRPDDPELLDQVIRTMRAQPEVVLTEQVSSGPDATPPAREFRLTGEQLVQAEVYAAGGATDIRSLPDEDGLTVFSLYIPGSFMWYRFWIDADYRLRRQVIINPGHRIERQFDYGPTEAERR